MPSGAARLPLLGRPPPRSGKSVQRREGRTGAAWGADHSLQGGGAAALLIFHPLPGLDSPSGIPSGCPRSTQNQPQPPPKLPDAAASGVCACSPSRQRRPRPAASVAVAPGPEAALPPAIRPRGPPGRPPQHKPLQTPGREASGAVSGAGQDTHRRASSGQPGARHGRALLQPRPLLLLALPSCPFVSPVEESQRSPRANGCGAPGPAVLPVERGRGSGGGGVTSGRG